MFLFINRQFFLDALPMTGTLGSLELMTELISDKTVTGNEADMWLTTLTFIKNPTKEMIQAVKVSYKRTEQKDKKTYLRIK